MAAMLALYHRDAQGGKGQVVDLAIFEPLLTILGPQPIAYDLLGTIPERTGNRSTNNAPRNAYRTADGRWVVVSSSATSIAERVMRLVGHPELVDEPWFATGYGRAAHVDLIDQLVGSWIAERTQDEVIQAFEAADAAVAPVYDIADVVADPHFRFRQSLLRVEDPDFGNLLMQNVLARFSSSKGVVRFTGRPSGADTDEILATTIGLNPDQLAELRARGVIG